jgi:hypothetical protein
MIVPNRRSAVRINGTVGPIKTIAFRFPNVEITLERRQGMDVAGRK